MLQPFGYYLMPNGDGQRLFGRPFLSCSTLNPKKVRNIMFGLVMVFVLVLITVAPPFAVMAKAKAKSRRR